MPGKKDKEKKDNNIEKAYAFWAGFYELHLYPSKGESFAKAILITVSCIGGVYVANPLVASCFLLFSLSIVMEYCVKLITSHKLIPKILPGVLIVLNLLVFFFSFADLFKEAATISHESFKYVVLAISLGIIWTDTVAALLFEKPDDPNSIESKLQNC